MATDKPSLASVMKVYEVNRAKWTEEQLLPYMGQWVFFSLDGTRALASAVDLGEAYEQLRGWDPARRHCFRSFGSKRRNRNRIVRNGIRMSLHFPYLPQPISGLAPPSLPPGTTHRFRPYLPIRVRSLQTGKSQLIQRAVLDTGADDTVFPENFVTNLGITLLSDLGPVSRIRWRGTPYPIRFAEVELQLTDKVTVYSWRAIVGFTTPAIPYPLLGQAGFLQYFNQTGRGHDRESILEPIQAFPGTIV